MTKKYYFTFGTSKQFPFYKGWVEVYAENRNDAVKIFNEQYPPVNEDIVNCAFIYDQEQFEATEMFSKGTWGSCHEVLGRSE